MSIESESQRLTLISEKLNNSITLIERSSARDENMSRLPVFVESKLILSESKHKLKLLHAKLTDDQ